MKKSKHAKKRMAQRALSEDVVQTVIDYGEDFCAPGGATKIALTKKAYQRRRDYHMQEIRRLDRAVGTAVVLCDDTIVTCMHVTR
jgi:hypothetical protein